MIIQFEARIASHEYITVAVGYVNRFEDFKKYCTMALEESAHGSSNAAFPEGMYTLWDGMEEISSGFITGPLMHNPSYLIEKWQELEAA